MNYLIFFFFYFISHIVFQCKKAKVSIENTWEYISGSQDKASEIQMTSDINWLSISPLKKMDWKGLMLTDMKALEYEIQNTHRSNYLRTKK